MQVIQPRAIVILPDEAFGRVDAAREVARIAIWSEELIALEGSPTCRVVMSRPRLSCCIRSVVVMEEPLGSSEDLPL